MAYGNIERMWNLQEYIEEYDKLKANYDRLFKRIKKPISKKPFKPGDKIRCPNCKAMLTLYR